MSSWLFEVTPLWLGRIIFVLAGVWACLWMIESLLVLNWKYTKKVLGEAQFIRALNQTRRRMRAKRRGGRK